MIVAAPARTLRQVALEYAIDDFDRITDDKIVRSTNAQPHQVKKITADNVPCRMEAAAVGHREHRCVRIDVRIG